MLSHQEQEIVFQLLDSGMSFTAIANQVHRSLGTIYKLKKIREFGTKEQGIAQEATPRKIQPFQEFIWQWIKQGKRNISRLFQEIQSAGYQGSYGLLNNYVQTLFSKTEKMYKRSSVKVETDPGEQAQVDWGSFGRIILNGREEKLYAFVYVLSYSRAIFVEFVVRQNQQTFQQCHIHAFQKFGIPQSVRYDNVKTVILQREKLLNGTKKFHFNPAFKDFALYYGFEIELCPPYWPRSKGKVEAGVKYFRYNFAEKNLFKKKFKTLEELNVVVWRWADTVANKRIHATTKEKPIERWEREKVFLRFSTGLPEYNALPLLARRSTKDGLVQYKSNLYSVPTEFSQKKLLVREIAKHGVPWIEMYYKNKLIAEHQIVPERGVWVVSNTHVTSTKKKHSSSGGLKEKNQKREKEIVLASRPLNYYDTLF